VGIGQTLQRLQGSAAGRAERVTYGGGQQGADSRLCGVGFEGSQYAGD
jgi:hypothetical protein